VATAPVETVPSTSSSVTSTPTVTSVPQVTASTSAVATPTSSSSTSTPTITTAPQVATSTSTSVSASTATATQSSTSTVSVTTKDPSVSPTVPASPTVQPVTPPVTTPVSTPTVTDSTIVPIQDPGLAAEVKTALGLKATDNITVGDIENYHGTVSVDPYDTKKTQVSSLNGLQYFQYLPSGSSLALGFEYSPSADYNLNYLKSVTLSSFNMTANYSKVDLSQLTSAKITPVIMKNGSVVQTPSLFEFFGNGPYQANTTGMTNQQLSQIAPWLVSGLNVGQPVTLEFNKDQITDFTPLKGFSQANSIFLVSIGNMHVDSGTINAVVNQPLNITAEPVLGLDGEDLASGYHFTYNAPALPGTNSVANGNLINLGNDQYQISKVQKLPNNEYLMYGYYGLVNNSADRTGFINKKYGNIIFRYDVLNYQKVNWQNNPSISIQYVDASGQPILSQGKALTKTIDGVNIGDSYDLTADSKVAGYKLTSAPTALVGKYTQDPQVIDLVYSKIPTPTSSNTPAKVLPVKVIPKSRQAVKIYTISGKPTGSDAFLADVGVRATTKIGGKLFYLVGYGQWVLASDYSTVKSETSGVVRTFGSDTGLVDAYGQPISGSLAPNSEWKYSRIVTISGSDYYQVATNEFLPVDSSIAFTPVTVKTNVNVTKKTIVYNSKGQQLMLSLPTDSNWVTDGCAIINGTKMYRVATDEWISSTSVTAYQPVSGQYHATKSTTLYDQTGQSLSRVLPANTSWKVDQVVVINGAHYYRVATNEYVRDYIDDK